MNWYKTSQQNVSQGYIDLMNQDWNSIQVTGSGLSETLSIPGTGITISAKELMERIKARIFPTLISNNVRTIDTGSIGRSDVGGQAISSFPGKIFVDIKKLFDLAKNSLPPVTQLDGIRADPSALNGVINSLSDWIVSEIAHVSLHESQHMHDMSEAYSTGKPFSSVQEAPAEEFAKKMTPRFFSQDFKM